MMVGKEKAVLGCWVVSCCSGEWTTVCGGGRGGGRSLVNEEADIPVLCQQQKFIDNPHPNKDPAQNPHLLLPSKGSLTALATLTTVTQPSLSTALCRLQ